MPYLPAVLALVSALCLLNLLLTLALIRKIHAQSALMKMSIEGIENPEPIMSVAGAKIGDYAAVTVDGEVASASDLVGETLVGFVSPSCPACAELLPSFILRAQDKPGGRDQVLAVAVGPEEEVGHLVEKLRPVARVIVEPPSGPVAGAFGVIGFPAFALIAGKTVVNSHFALDRVPESIGQ